MKSNPPFATELVIPLPIDGEWLALEQNPTTTSSYLRVIASDGTELSYQPVRLDSIDSWTALRRTFLLGSSVSPYIELSTSNRFRALVQSNVEGVAAYDFEAGICVLENGSEISIDDCEMIRRHLATHLGVEILPIPTGSQRSVDLAIQLIRRFPEAFSIGGPLARARLHRRLTGLEGRWVTAHFADGRSDSGIVERTGQFLPRYSLRRGSHERIIDPAATILLVDLTSDSDGTQVE